jgi:hypothetical protein
MKLKNITYYSYGIDLEEDGTEYWYLQTASDGYEDTEIISSKYKLPVYIVGKVISFFTRKKLRRW